MKTHITRTAQTILIAGLLTAMVSGMGEAAHLAPKALAAMNAPSFASYVASDATILQQNDANLRRAQTGAIVTIP